MKIIELQIEGFRSFKSQTWRPTDLNVLIGQNASGKSNLLRTLEVLNASAKGELGRTVQQEGGVDALLWDSQVDQILLRSKMTPLPPYKEDALDALTYELVLAQLGTSSAYRIEREILGNFSAVEAGMSADPHVLLQRDPSHAVVYSINSQRFEASPDSLSEAEPLLSAAAGPFAANRFVAEFQKELAAWKIHQDFRTDRDAKIRSPQVTRSDSIVAAGGENLTSVLHTLCSRNRDFEGDANAAMRAAFGDDFESLRFSPVPGADQRIELRVRWRSLRNDRSVAELSDGTLRFLYLFAILANPDPPPLIAIDEPETGLHPSMLPIVADCARDASRRSQVILTTHSPEFLDAFGRDAPTTTVVERVDGQTQLKTICEDELSYWLKRYSLGELYRTHELEAMP